MGIREIIAKALGYKLGTPQGGFNGLIEMQTPPGWGYQNYLKAYGEVGWLFACVNVIANAVARQEWHLYELNKDNEREEIFKHPILDLFHKFNPYQTRYQFMYLGTMYKKLVGEQFWQINFNGKRQPAEIWLAPPTFMSVIPSSQNYIDHYEFKRNNQITKFNVDEIIHIMTPDPFNPYRGKSEAQALTSIIDSERYAASLQNKMFFNDGRPGFIIEYPAADMPNSESRKELVQEWDERYKGYRNAGKTAFLWGGKANTLTLSPRDMDFNNLRAFSRDTILGAYGVPKSVLGLTESSTYASAKAGNYTFAYYVIHPELCALREAINKELVPFFGDNLYMDFDNPVPEDETMQVNNAVALYKGGIAKLNEARIMIALEPVDEGDEFYFQPTPMLGYSSGDEAESQTDNSAIDETPDKDDTKKPGDKPKEEEENSKDDKKKAKKKSYDEMIAEVYWKEYVKRSESYEIKMIKALNDIFNNTQEEITTKIESGEKNALINKSEIREAYKIKVTPILTMCFQESVKAGKELINPENPHKEAPEIINVLNPQAVEWLKKRIAWAAEEIGETLAKELNDSLLEGFTRGESIPDLTKRVNEFFDNKTRSQRIARTETISASAQGAIEGYKESGVVQKIQFYTSLDERTCDYCMEYHNKIYQIGQEMPIPLHPNCLLPNVRVETSHLISGSRAFYRGEAIEITTKNGNVLTCTPNHPILSFNGFIKAKGFNKGDYVISSLNSERIINSIDPNNYNSPSPIKDVWNSLAMQNRMFLTSMPVTSHDFYGDARFFDGNIDIINPDSLLLNNRNIFISEHTSKYILNSGDSQKFRFSSSGSEFFLSDRLVSTPCSNMRGGSTCLTLLKSHKTHRNNISLTDIANCNTSLNESTIDNSPIYTKLSRKFQSRFTGLITPDKIIDIKRFYYIGHVYDLQSLDQLYIANNIVVKNCRCVFLPVIE